MRLFRRFLYGAIMIVFVNLNTIYTFLRVEYQAPLPYMARSFLTAAFTVMAVLIIIFPQPKRQLTSRIQQLSNGCELLHIFMLSAMAATLFQLYILFWAFKIIFPWNAASASLLAHWFFGALLAFIGEAAVFWGGMLRVYITSVQLGIKYRVLGALFAWIPVLNICYLLKIERICRAEVDFESEKQLLNEVRAQSRQCETKYPLLLVHGVFFRDFRYFNYWGRVPAELIKNGATVYYGHQQSAASVEDSARELAARIRGIVEETGCSKVNIIAHSKGGLDCRSAISRYGAAEYVASLTTVNTPHNGCLFAEHLLNKIPRGICFFIARAYNNALKQMGDSSPDFLAAITDLTAGACTERNKSTPNAANVLYESVMSYCIKAKSGKFPLNVSYPIVKRYDGKNDGLVSVESARWGENFTLLGPRGKRGISHGDMIDLNRENIEDFDVREFYVSLVSSLKSRGY